MSTFRHMFFSILATGILWFASLAPAKAEESTALPQLDPTTFPTQLFWLFVFFITLYLILSTVALPRISKVLESRHDKIRQDLEDAQSLKEKTEKIKTDYETALATAHENIAELMKDTHETIMKRNVDGHAALSEKLSTLSEKAEKKITDQTAKAIEQVQEASTLIAMEISNKLAPIVVNDNEASSAVQTHIKKGGTNGA